MASVMRHAVARPTGATTWARKEDEGWQVTCLNHNTNTTVPNRATAWTTSSHPHEWCAKCKAIAAGKAKYIEDGRLDIPKAKPTRRKAPAKKATTTKKATKPDTKTVTTRKVAPTKKAA